MGAVNGQYASSRCCDKFPIGRNRPRSDHDDMARHPDPTHHNQPAEMTASRPVRMATNALPADRRSPHLPGMHSMGGHPRPF
jgi:hypothetical protein